MIGSGHQNQFAVPAIASATRINTSKHHLQFALVEGGSHGHLITTLFFFGPLQLVRFELSFHHSEVSAATVIKHVAAKGRSVDFANMQFVMHRLHCKRSFAISPLA